MITRRVAPAALAAAILFASLLAGPTRSVAAGGCPSATFCAGAAGADITPPVTTPMWGYTARQGVLNSSKSDQFSRDKQNANVDRYDKTFVANHGIHLRLFANAYVIQGVDGAKVAVVQTDLGGLPGELHQAVANRLAGTGIDRDHLLIGATHTHQGPGGIFQYQGYAVLGGDEFDPRVFDAVAQGITNAVLRANARLTPAKMAWGTIPTVGANRNRRVSPQWCENTESRCVTVAGKMVPGPDSPSTNDPMLTVIRIDRADGVPLGVITNFAAHGTIGGDDNLLFSGDNQGWATRLIARGIADAYGAPLPGGWEIVDALINGAAGDHSPVGDNAGYNWGSSTNRAYSEMEDAGARQAAPAIQEWRALGSQLRDDFTVDSRFTFLCFCGQKVDAPYLYGDDAAETKIDKADPIWDHVSPYASLGQAGVTGSDGTSSPVALPGQGHKLPVLDAIGSNPSVVRLQTLRIGDLLFAGVPGEPTVTVSRRLHDALMALPGRASAYREVLTAGLANDYDSYFSTPEEQTAYQYEGSFTLFGPQQSPLLAEELSGLAARMIAGTAVPACVEDPVFCATHPDHPDTSATVITPMPIGVDATPVIVSQPAAAVSRFGVAAMSWNGGSPSAEWRLDADRVQVQRIDAGGSWVTVAGDAHDTATVLRYDRVDNAHRWTAQWDVARDAAPGTYRMHIVGAYGSAPGTASAYTLDSSMVAVTPTAGLRVFITPGGGAVKVSAGYPQPDATRSFRWRPRFVTAGTAEVTVTRSGSPVTITAPVDASGVTTLALEPGDTVAGARVTDAFANTGAA